MNHTLVVSEVFGPTIQGEGPFTGRQASFIRLGACNLSCTWCDTPYTWDGKRFDLRSELSRKDVDAILKAAVGCNTPIVIISGGEPLLQQGDDFTALLLGLHNATKQIHVETNGTKVPMSATRALVDHFSVSPKLANSGDPEANRIKLDVLREFNALAEKGQACFKFVAQEPDDLVQIDGLCKQVGIKPEHVWVMGEGQEPQDNLRSLMKVADQAINRGWNLSTRLHTLLWGTVRGV